MRQGSEDVVEEMLLKQKLDLLNDNCYIDIAVETNSEFIKMNLEN